MTDYEAALERARKMKAMIPDATVKGLGRVRDLTEGDGGDDLGATWQPLVIGVCMIGVGIVWLLILGIKEAAK